MDERTEASLLWGVVAGLAFLVLVQGYHLAGSERVAIPVAAGVALAVAAAAAVLTYLAEGWLTRHERTK